MTPERAELDRVVTEDRGEFDVIVIGAGITGIYQLYRLRERGFDVRVVEAGSGVGGTWFWNRYPGARFDSESYSYAYFFSESMLEDWNWSEHFAGQEEIERYLNCVVDRFDLRDNIDFDTRIARGVFDEGTNRWTLTSNDGRVFTARFVISATGILSAPFRPDVADADAFGGVEHHTGEWPREPVDLAGKRVAVIGTGSSGVQIIPIIAPQVQSLTVFQRTPNWCCPLNNSPIDADEMQEIKDGYDRLRNTLLESPTGFVHVPPGRRTFEDSDAQRSAFYDRIWESRGLGKLHGNYDDAVTDADANRAYAAYIAHRIRAQIHDPNVADMLIPDDHGPGMKRMPMETGYYATYNRRNVHLVDLRKTPLERLTRSGIRTTDGIERDFDVIVWATGFDAFTGALTRMDLVGTDGRTLREAWVDGAVTYLGVQIPKYPNLFIESGPHAPGGNFPRSTETQVDFVTDLLVHARERKSERVEPQDDACERWTVEVADAASEFLVAESAWFQGSNIPGKAKQFLAYPGPLTAMRRRFRDTAATGFPGFEFDGLRSGRVADEPARIY